MSSEATIKWNEDMRECVGEGLRTIIYRHAVKIGIHSLHNALPKVVGFIGELDTVPTPMPAAKLQEMLQQVETGMVAPRQKRLFAVGEMVRVAESPVRDFTGMVEAVRPER